LSGDILVHVKKDGPADKIELELATLPGAKKLRFARFDTPEALSAAGTSPLASAAVFLEARGNRAFFSASVAAPTGAVPFYIKVQASDESGKIIAERKIRVAPL
jgi:hypothetical protein